MYLFIMVIYARQKANATPPFSDYLRPSLPSSIYDVFSPGAGKYAMYILSWELENT